MHHFLESELVLEMVVKKSQVLIFLNHDFLLGPLSGHLAVLWTLWTLEVLAENWRTQRVMKGQPSSSVVVSIKGDFTVAVNPSQFLLTAVKKSR